VSSGVACRGKPQTADSLSWRRETHNFFVSVVDFLRLCPGCNPSTQLGSIKSEMLLLAVDDSKNVALFCASGKRCVDFRMLIGPRRASSPRAAWCCAAATRHNDGHV
jgi:hypothetical protein